MSRDALKRVHVAENDPVINKVQRLVVHCGLMWMCPQFQQDAQVAKMTIATPQQRKVSTETDLEREADEALKDPKKAKELEEESVQAEMDLTGPMSFLEEDEDVDFTDDEDGGIPFDMTHNTQCLTAQMLTALPSWVEAMLMSRRRLWG